MYKTNLINPLLVLILFLGVTLACAASHKDKACGNNPFLKDLINAKSERDFSELLMQHGPVQQEEMPCIIDAIDSSDKQKRLFGAELLIIVRGDEQVVFEAEKKVVLETSDVRVWSEIMDSLIYGENPNLAELAAKRPDMVNKALKYTNNDDKRIQGKVQSIGLKVGILAKLPGLEDEVIKRLDADDSELISVALDAMSADLARSQLPHLLKMLDEYEAGKTYTGLKDAVFSALIDALIRTEDQQTAYPAARKSLEKGFTNNQQINGARDEYENFRNKIVFVKADYVRKFFFYLINENSVLKPSAFDILTTPVWANKQEADKEVVKKCVELIEKGNLATDPRKHLDDKTGQHECEQMFYFLETKDNPISPQKPIKYGADALAFGQKWIKEN